MQPIDGATHGTQQANGSAGANWKGQHVELHESNRLGHSTGSASIVVGVVLPEAFVTGPPVDSRTRFGFH